jgi:hypothetical protein
MDKDTIAAIDHDLTTLYEQPTEEKFYEEWKAFSVKYSKYKEFINYLDTTFITHSR